MPETNTNDPSGSHHLPVPEDTAATLRVPRGTLIAVIAALGAGLVGTGGTAALLHGGDGGAGVAQVATAVSEVKAQLVVTQGQLADMNRSVLSMAGDLKSDAEAHRRTDDQLADHEQRLRALERRAR